VPDIYRGDPIAFGPMYGTGTPVVKIAKKGEAFDDPAGFVAPMGFGMFSLSGNQDDTDTPGQLLVHAVQTGDEYTWSFDVKPLLVVASDDSLLQGINDKLQVLIDRNY
jgi:hypothetical protein